MTAKIVGIDEYKGYKLVNGFGSMVEIKALGKGKVSVKLSGSYTSQTEARKAVDKFVSENGVKIDETKISKPKQAAKGV